MSDDQDFDPTAVTEDEEVEDDAPVETGEEEDAM